MKKFIFEIVITQDMLEGDEFWEQALKRDGTGIADVTALLKNAISDGVLMGMYDGDMNGVVKLTKFIDG